MIKFVIKRILWLIVVCLATAVVIFSILYVTPRNPAAYILGGATPQAEIDAFTHKLGLDRPYLTQLGDFMWSVVRLKFDNSWVYGTPVFDEVLARLPVTLIIGLSSAFIGTFLGIGLGMIAGVNANKWQDSVIMAIAIFLMSAPDFWLALLMIILFSAKLGWLPAYGVTRWTGYIMPIIALSIESVAGNARQTRSSILEVYRADFITTARAKGQKEGTIILKHMMPNALMPVITNLGNTLSRVVAGSTVIESVFTIPGIGLYMLTAINYYDYPIIRCCVIFFAVFAAVMMLITDIVYGFIDPRIKSQYVSKKKVAE